MKVRKLNIFDIFLLKEFLAENVTNKTKTEFLKTGIFGNGNLWGVFGQNRTLSGILKTHHQIGNKKRLFIDETIYSDDEAGVFLVQFIIKYYAKKGVNNFAVYVHAEDDMRRILFSKKCGFRFCSGYAIYKIRGEEFEKTPPCEFERFRARDAKEVCELYNEGLSVYFRAPLQKTKDEFCDTIFTGTTRDRYVLKSENGNIYGYFEIKYNEKATVARVILNSPYEYMYKSVISAISGIIKEKNINADLFVNHKKYMTSSEFFEEILRNAKSEKISDKWLFIKDFYRPSRAKVSLTEIFSDLTSPAPAYMQISGLQKGN